MFQPFNDNDAWSKHGASDHDLLGRRQTRYSRERNCELRWPGNNQSAMRFHSHKHGYAGRPVSNSGRWQQTAMDGRWRWEDDENRGRLSYGWRDERWMEGKIHLEPDHGRGKHGDNGKQGSELKRFGEPYGFVKFSNVKDITKMTNALNAVWFGHFRVRASVAKFERNDVGRDRVSKQEKVGLSKGAEIPLKKDSNQNPTRQAMLEDGDDRIISTGSKMKNGGDAHLDLEKEGCGPLEGVRVGDIVIQLGTRQERVLIATSDLDIVKRTEKVLVDGVLVEIKIVEEWGYAMGEDSCLFEEESETEASHSDFGEGHADPEVCRNADFLVDKIAGGLDDDKGVGLFGECDDVLSEKLVGTLSDEGESVEEVEQIMDFLRPASDRLEAQPTISLDLQGELGARVLRRGEPVRRVGVMLRNDRANSCPPTERRNIITGPWSLEWLQDNNHGEAGVLFSASKTAQKGDPHGVRQKKEGQLDSKRRKAGGMLRHPLHSLKRIARLPSEDRDEVLKNWVAMQGNAQMVEDDVNGIGKSIGVTFKGDNDNRFIVLSRANLGKKEKLGKTQGEGVQKEKRSGRFRKEEGGAKVSGGPESSYYLYSGDKVANL
ncbi:hypothetical protein TSUD_398030 [Trifolium subterraneum]|uniref:DUF4283 domain-containing protein n=1 Tax=Trifolium subterraneum TaxID=3900 RepID=A0A2Z6P9N8_TRISU|nr:hypothetical protein TSUD_398030 [Trifolium subterraneum]